MSAPTPDLQAASGARRRAWRAARHAIAVILVAGAGFLLWWQLRDFGLASIGRAIASAAPVWVGAVVALVLLRHLVSAWRLAVITRALTPCTTWPFVTMGLASQFAGLVVPGLRVGPVVLRAHLASAHFGGRRSRHLAANAIDQGLLGVTWLAAAGAAAPQVAAAGGLPVTVSPWVGAIAVVLVGSGALALRRVGPRLAEWLERPHDGWIGRLRVAGGHSLTSALAMLAKPRVLAAGLIGGAVFVVVTGYIQYSALSAVGAAAPWTVALVSVVVGSALGAASGVPSGIGVTEAAEVAFIAHHGVRADHAAAGVIIARGTIYLATVVLGGICFAREAWAGRVAGILSRRPLGDPSGVSPDQP